MAGAACLAGGLGVVLSSNPVHSALMLILTLFSVAVLFVAQEAHFLAAVQVIVYAGAIVVLFLFVIMLLGVDRFEDIRKERLKGQRPLAAVAGLAVLAAVLVLARTEWVSGAKSVAGSAGDPADNVGDPGPVALHPLPAGLRGHLGPARHRRRRRRRARPPPPRQGQDERVRVPGAWYLALAAALFCIGAVGLLIRRNVLVMFMCVELMLNAVNLTFVTFARMLDDIGGQSAVFFVLVVAAAEVVVGLGIIVSIFRRRTDATADDLSVLKG